MHWQMRFKTRRKVAGGDFGLPGVNLEAQINVDLQEKSFDVPTNITLRSHHFASLFLRADY